MGHTRHEMVWTLLFVLVLAVCALMLYVAARMEPHWASKDGHRCICRGQHIDQYGLPVGRWREYRVEIYDDGQLDVRPRSRFTRDRIASWWRVVGKSDDPPPRREIFLLRSVSEPHQQMALRLPSNSRANPVLEEAMKA